MTEDSTVETPLRAVDDAERQADPTPGRPERFYALDALRGLAIGLMVAVNFAGNAHLPPTFDHAEWHGLMLADAVFPGFMVAMGAAMPYSTRTGWRKAFGRAIMLLLIGSALVSHRDGVPFGLSSGVLQMTGIAYLLTWLVTCLPRAAQLPVVVALQAGITAAYLWLDVPGVPAGSFGPDTNLGLWFDTILGMAPHPENAHAWLSAVGSVYIGVLAGRISRENTGARRIGLLAGLGGVTLALGLLLSSIVPINKFLWTSSFVLVTGGLAVAALVLLALVIPGNSKGGAMRPLVVLGGHAIVVYAFAETVVRLIAGWLWWPTWEPLITERYGELTGAVTLPLIVVLTCMVLAGVMELLNIHVRL